MIHEQKVNQNVLNIKPSGIRKFFDLAQSMEGVISLGVGEPDFVTPYHIREAAMYSLEVGKTYYTANAGLLELREEICEYLARRFNIQYNTNQVVVTVGGSEAIDIALRTILQPEDEVIVLTPAYVAYEPCVTINYGVVKVVELVSENEFKLTKDMLEGAITPKTKAIILNYPSNPTGGIMTYEDYLPLIEVIKKHELYVISDEIYAELTYGREHYSIACFEEIKDQVILIQGFSKAYAMTGWRLGYVCANEFLISLMLKVHQFAIMCPPTMAQFAAISALQKGDSDVQMMRESFEARRNYLVQAFRAMDLEVFMPQGAFYLFLDIRKFNLSDTDFCEQLLTAQKVALVPGSAFGDAGAGFVRISYAYSIEEIKEAITKIAKFIETL